MGKINELRILPPDKTGEQINKVITDVISVLQQVNGPLSNYALIYHREPGGGGPKITRDGANVLRALTSECPYTTMLLTLIKSIANTIEKKVGDGTTSSTIATLEFIRILRKFPYEQKSPVELNNSFAHLRAHIGEFIEANRICFDNASPEALRGLFYAQAYTASHGNKVLSETIRDWLSILPKEKLTSAYHAIDYRATKAVELITYEADFISYGYRPTNVDGMRNNYNLTEIESDDCNVLFIDFVDSDVVEHLEEDFKSLDATKPLYIFTTYDRGTNNLNILRTCMENHNLKGGVFVRMIQDVGHITPLVCIQAYLGNDATRTNEFGYYIAQGAKLHTKGNEVYINNLFEYDASGLIKGYGSKALEKLYFSIDAKHKEPISDEAKRDLLLMENSLTYRKFGVLTLGGDRSTINKNTDIIDDVLTSCSTAITHGVVLGGLKGIANSVNEYLKNNEEDMYVSALASALYMYCGLGNPRRSYDVISKTEIPFTLEEFEKETPKIITQPATVVQGLIDAIDDHVLQLAFLSTIIL